MNIILITGGSRSGKSSYALSLALNYNPPRTFIATASVTDQEMALRIQKHKKERENQDFDTIEEPINLRNALLQAKNSNIVLVDCLTLWVNNLLFNENIGEANENSVDWDTKIKLLCDEVIEAQRHVQGDVILVSNEVGMGIVPENFLARTFRDVAGRCNQIFAKKAREVYLMVAGYPLKVK